MQYEIFTKRNISWGLYPCVCIFCGSEACKCGRAFAPEQLQIVLLLRCHLDGEQSDNVFIMDPPPPLIAPTPVPTPKQEAGMLGFHDANEVKTWQCVAGSP